MFPDASDFKHGAGRLQHRGGSHVSTNRFAFYHGRVGIDTNHTETCGAKSCGCRQASDAAAGN